MSVRLTSWLHLSNWTQPEIWCDSWFDQDDLLSQIRVEWPLDWILHMGGPVRQRAESLVAIWANQHRADGSSGATELVMLKPMPLDPIIEFERAEWIKGFRSAFPGIRCVDGRSATSAFDSSVDDWSRELLGSEPIWLLEAAQRFCASVWSHRFEPPWMFWSRFPMHLRKDPKIDSVRGEHDAVIRALDARLSRIRIALSPHNEADEAFGLKPGQIKLNPTFDVIREGSGSGQRDGLKGIVRTEQKGKIVLEERLLDELDAVIIDEVRESFRVSEVELIQRLGIAGAADRIGELNQLGFILRSAHSANS